MEKKGNYFFVVIAIFCCAQFSNAANLKYCVPKTFFNLHLIQDICSMLKLHGENVECIIAKDRLSCMRAIIKRDAAFTVFGPNDLIVAVENLEYHLVITHELQPSINETAFDGMVAIVHKHITDISDMRKALLCYPGLQLEKNYFESFFEKTIMNANCDPRKTLLENRISDLSRNFQAACIAGPWSLDAQYDSELKSRYRNLCALCNNPLGCYKDDLYWNTNGALSCLTENVGDIAWTEFQNAKGINRTNSEFHYLCPDNTVRSLESEPCIWVNKPNYVVAARVDIADQVSEFIKQQVSVNGRFLRLLQPWLNFNPPVKLKEFVSPEVYLRKFPSFLNAKSPASCYPSREVRWCTSSSLEYAKCQALKAAADASGIKPIIFCIQESRRSLCLDAVKFDRADLFVVKPKEELEARKKGLKPILHMLPNTRESANKVGAIVGKDSKYNYLKDLKGAKACFTSYRSTAWNAFVSIISNDTSENWDCSDEKLVSNYFSESCVFANKKNDETLPENLRSLCKKFASNNLFRQYSYDEDIMALKCLLDSGDVAFVNISRVKEVFEREGGIFNDRFKSLCINESDEKEGNCFLTWTSLGAIMIHENQTEVREKDIVEMLLSMDMFFGRSLTNFINALFFLYGEFENTEGLIFPEKSRHLQRVISHVRRGRSYSDVLDELVKRQSLCNKSEKLTLGSFILVWSIFMTFLCKFL